MPSELIGPRCASRVSACRPTVNWVFVGPLIRLQIVLDPATVSNRTRTDYELELLMTVAVTGASGKLGRLVAEGLLDALGPEGVVLITRAPGKLTDLAARGADV